MPSDGRKMEFLQSISTDQDAVADATYAFPLTFAQLRLWFVEQLDPDQTSYLVPWALKIRGPLNVDALAYSLNQIVLRHEIFRTKFVAAEGEPRQVVSHALHIALPLVDLSHLAPGEGEVEAQRRAREESQTPMDLQAGPLLRAQLLRLNSEEHLLLLTTHHIIFDGWSRSVLVRELGSFYESFLFQKPTQLHQLPIQYADFAVWQREHLSGEFLDRQLAYWKDQLQDMPATMELPTDHPRPAIQTYNGATVRFALPTHLAQPLKALTQRQSVTAYMILLAAFQALLARYTGQLDIIIGTPIANRNRSELEGLIGLFANTLVLRTKLDGNPTFRELLGRVKETALSAYAHEEMPFEKLVQELRPDRNLSHSPLFQVLFSLRNTPSATFRLGGLDLEFVSGGGETSKYDLSLYLEEENATFGGKLEYNTDLFDRSTIERLLDHYRILLQAAVLDPDKRLSELEMLSAAERDQQLLTWNTTAREYQDDRCVHELFEFQAARRAEATAVLFAEERLTYRELNEQANQLAHCLHSRGVGLGHRVGLFLERSPALMVALLGIQKSGAAYVPLDPAYPEERLKSILDGAGITLLVTEEKLLSALPDYLGPVLCLDRDEQELSQQSVANPRSGATAQDVVYVIFTSGSTGRPKGVEVGHRGVVNLLEWMSEELDLHDADVFPALASFAFDMSVPELYLPLISGGTLALAKRHLAADGEELARFLRTYQAKTVHATPTTWSLLLDAGYTGQGIKRCIGAEPLPAELFARLMDAAPDTPLYNFYGPTETTVWSTFYRFTSKAQPIVIGQPLANTQIYILDDAGRPVPIGVPGEILIGGDGVARGYLNQPELTAEKFILDPFSSDPQARLYRTGDLGRYLADGKIEFAGRIDHQVKIRGYRIELGEIETVLTKQDNIRECVVMAREDTVGDKRLVAYAVPEPGATLEVESMRQWVKDRLPEYMVPSAFIILERMPLSPNGKVDRKALSAPDDGSVKSKIGQMGDPVEELIANLWAEVLKAGEVTQNANFFDLGGHSLLATKVVARIRQMLNVELPLVAIFEAPTVAGLAARVRALVREGHTRSEPAMLPVDWATSVPLSFAQQRLWFLDQLEPNSPFYNVRWAVRLTGTLNPTALEAAMNEIAVRQDSLRTTFQIREGEPVQVVAPAFPFPLNQIDLTHIPDADREAEAHRLVGEEARRPFSLSVGPLFRALLLKLSENVHVLMVNIHHAISDGWSLGILSTELAVLYEAFQAGKPSPLPPLALKYRDYAVWQRNYLAGGALEQQLTYWKKHMEGAPLSIELPTDRIRPTIQTFGGAKHIIMLPKHVLDGLKALSRAEGGTLFITLLAAFNVLLARYSGQQDLVVGTAIAGRHHPDTEKLIGFFANTLVLRTNLAGEPTFRQLLQRVRETTLNAYANQDVPFEKLVEELNPVRDMSRSPLFQVMIIQQNAFQRAKTFGSLSAEGFTASGSEAKVDLLLNVAELGGELRCALEYNTDLYDASTIERLLEHYRSLLELVVEDPSQRVSEIALQRSAEKHQLLVEWNNTSADYPKEKCVHELIEEQAALSPQAAAVVFVNQQLSYAELNSQANQLAHHLRANGLQPNERVAIYLERSLAMMVTLLAVQKAGAASVPLDPAYPVERLGLIMEDAGIACLITQESLLSKMPAFRGPVVCLEHAAASIVSQSDSNPVRITSSEDLMYVIFTSGSTGRPKGVEVPHRGVVNLLAWMGKELDMGPGDTFPALASFAFDMSVPELYLPLTTGGTVLLVPRGMAANGEELAEFLIRHHATVVHATPTTWSLLLDAGYTGAGLKRCVGAEMLPRELFRRLMSSAQSTPLYNLYGPTETTVWSTFHRFTDLNERIVVGRPLANTQVYVLDANRQPVPVGVAGGIYIGGDGVTRGYLGQPDLTAEKFIANPFAGDSKLYYTGDVGRYLPDGRIEYIERADHQVKIRGFRIELGEIEAVLARHSTVRECVVVAREDQPGNKFLAAYLVAKNPDAPLDVHTLRSFAKDHLPEYMVPIGWMELDRLPLSANGKVDRGHLPIPDQRATKVLSGAEPRSLIQIRLANIWEEILNVPSVRLDDDFFNLGGHSLLAVQMMSRAREAFGCELPLTLLFGAPKLGDLAQIIQAERGKHPFKTIIPIRKGGTRPPLFCISRPNANALGFIFLARNLSPDQPVVALQSQMEKDGSSWVYDQTEYEAKAKEYIHAMREDYPNGPYFLTGYCEGAHIAFEMARELEAMKLPVAMIAILDAWPIENTVSHPKFILAGYVREFRRFRKLNWSDRLKYLVRSLLRHSGFRSSSVPQDPAAAAAAVQRKIAADQIKKRYWPGPGFEPTKFSGRLTLFRTKKQIRVRINDYYMGWRERALGGVDVIPVPGTHVLLLREPYVIDLAQQMQACMDRILEADQQPVTHEQSLPASLEVTRSES